MVPRPALIAGLLQEGVDRIATYLQLVPDRVSLLRSPVFADVSGNGTIALHKQIAGVPSVLLQVVHRPFWETGVGLVD